MEDPGYLDPDNALQLYCLHFVYMPHVQAAIDGVVRAWNHHNMSSKALKGQSPIKQWQLGEKPGSILVAPVPY